MIKQSRYYENIYPLEDLLPPLDERIVSQIVINDDYTVEADAIARKMEMPDTCVNDVDCTIFYMKGYEAAMERLSKILIPIEK